MFTQTDFSAFESYQQIGFPSGRVSVVSLSAYHATLGLAGELFVETEIAHEALPILKFAFAHVLLPVRDDSLLRDEGGGGFFAFLLGHRDGIRDRESSCKTIYHARGEGVCGVCRMLVEYERPEIKSVAGEPDVHRYFGGIFFIYLLRKPNESDNKIGFYTDLMLPCRFWGARSLSTTNEG